MTTISLKGCSGMLSYLIKWTQSFTGRKLIIAGSWLTRLGAFLIGEANKP